MTLSKVWELLMGNPEIKKSESRIRPIRSNEMPDLSSICSKCKKPYVQHDWDEDKELVIHPKGMK